MSTNDNLRELTEKFGNFLESVIVFDTKFDGAADTILNKLSFLERLIELTRYHNNRETRNSLTLDEILRWDIDFLLNGRVYIKSTDSDAPIVLNRNPRKPIELEIPLLMYLLVGNKSRRPILEQIDGFIREIADHLRFADFEHTGTGVIRCFTNTRFAANDLRLRGLLKYSDRERFKTWELSIFGIVVATSLYSPKWRDDLQMRRNWWQLEKRLTDSCNQFFALLCQKENFVRVLTQLLKSNNSNSKEFSEAVNRVVMQTTEYVKLAFKSPGRPTQSGVQDFLEKVENNPLVDKLLRNFKTSYEMIDFNLRVKEFFFEKSADNGKNV